LAPYGVIARSHPEGGIDLSQGTPVDPTPEFIQERLRQASNSPSYPLTAGTAELRQAIKDWATRTLGASGEFDVLPTIGSKEFVAWLPTFLQAKRVLYPKVAYPTYLVGSMIAGADATAVEIDADSWPEADLAWVNTPSNPTGRVHSVEELSAVVDLAHRSEMVVACDECYINFPSSKEPISILRIAKGNNRNILAVHSLSKRSNLAGYRGAFVIGDPLLIAQIREVRKHAGMMVPLPVQEAMVAALSDETHVAAQADRYRKRREALSGPLQAAGFRIDYTEAGLYIWCSRGESDWDSVKWLAELGILATPGRFYGPEGDHHIRVALTATDEAIARAANRIASA
jgi:succinyldiaminopimelate transaminase